MWEFTGMIIQVLICHPVGYVRWFIFRRKPLESYLHDDFEINLGALAATLGVALLIVGFVRNILSSPY